MTLPRIWVIPGNRPGDDAQVYALAEELGLPPVKIHCSVLAEDAIKAAVKDYQAKNATTETKTEEAAVSA